MLFKSNIKLAKLLLVAFLSNTFLISCKNKENSGSLIGIIGGAGIGSQLAGEDNKVLGATIGALVGGIIGGSVGKNLDQKDKKMLLDASLNALEYVPSGQSIGWRNPETGHHGYITPSRPYKQGEQFCREYIQTIYAEEKTPETTYGKACRQQDGNWKIAE